MITELFSGGKCSISPDSAIKMPADFFSGFFFMLSHGDAGFIRPKIIDAKEYVRYNEFDK